MRPKFENITTTAEGTYTSPNGQQSVGADTSIAEKLQLIERQLNKLTTHHMSSGPNVRSSLIVPNRASTPTNAGTTDEKSLVNSPTLSSRKVHETPITPDLSPDMGLLLQKITEMNTNIVTFSSRLDRLEKTTEGISSSNIVNSLPFYRDPAMTSPNRSETPNNPLSRKGLKIVKNVTAVPEVSAQSGFLKQTIQVQGPSKELLRNMLSPTTPGKVNISFSGNNES